MSDDRSTILRRRAFFVTSAVAALGSCARGAPPAEPVPPAEISVPHADPDAGQSDAALMPTDRDSPSSALPPLDVPDGVSETAREKYERLASVMRRAYAILDELEAELPSCSILDSACEPRFRRAADRLHDLDGLFQRFFVCGGTSEEAKAYGEREKAHQTEYRKRRARIEAELERALETAGQPAHARWQELRREAYQAAPFPCLKFGCPDW